MACTEQHSRLDSDQTCRHFSENYHYTQEKLRNSLSKPVNYGLKVY